MTRREIYRILDANFNRSREGLRVCEEICRFILKDERSSRQFRKLRHAVTQGVTLLPIPPESLCRYRDSESDLGRKWPEAEKKSSVTGVFLANAERVKESFRVLEEFSKLSDMKVSAHFKELRFRIYELEKRVLPRMASLRHR